MSKIVLIRRSYIYNMIDMEQEYKLSGHWDFQELNWLIIISQNIEIHGTVFISGCTGTNFAMVEKKCYQLVDIKIKSVKAYDCSSVSVPRCPSSTYAFFRFQRRCLFCSTAMQTGLSSSVPIFAEHWIHCYVKVSFAVETANIPLILLPRRLGDKLFSLVWPSP